MLNWASRFNIFCFLDHQQYLIPPHQYECLLAIGWDDQYGAHSLQEADELSRQGHWLFGHLSFELDTPTHQFKKREQHIGFPDCFFFVPRFLVQLGNGFITCTGENPESIYQEIMSMQQGSEPGHAAIQLQPVMNKQGYLETINALKAHIHRGDCYEINFCLEHTSSKVSIDPLQVYKKLSALSPNPFSAFYRMNERYLVCASPERFISKRGSKIIAQPIKGTAARSTDPFKDAVLKNELKQSKKEQAENVMIVDLMRNDLSRICEDGSVKVDELFGLYTYPQVHQMISTISGILQDQLSFSRIIKALFPMGSMTGAPKKRVLELIETYEPGRRGLFSGSVGYIDPCGDFDFNVVIRSLLYNQLNGNLACWFGSAITAFSDAEAEWNECMLKGAAIRKVLEG